MLVIAETNLIDFLVIVMAEWMEVCQNGFPSKLCLILFSFPYRGHPPVFIAFSTNKSAYCLYCKTHAMHMFRNEARFLNNSYERVIEHIDHDKIANCKLLTTLRN